MSSKKMQVAMLDPANLTPYYNYALCSGLNKVGIQTTLYSTQFLADETLEADSEVDLVDFYFRQFRSLQQSNLQFLRQILRGISYPFDHYRLLQQFKRNKPDLVHWQWTRLPIVDNWLLKRLRAAKIPCVITVHDVTPVYRTGSDKQRLRVLSKADALIVHDANSKVALLARYPKLTPEKIHEIPHGPLQANNLGSECTRGSARLQLNIETTRKVVLFFGEIKEYKGLDVLIEAFSTLDDPDSALMLLVAGQPSDGCKPDFSVLDRKKLTYQSDLRYLPSANVWKYYYAADLVVLPYREISQSGVLFSALAHGRPVITTAVGGMPSVVNRVDGGWVIPPDNTVALAAAITYAFSDMKQLRAKGEKAKIAVEDIYSWRAIGEKTKQVYQEICTTIDFQKNNF